MMQTFQQGEDVRRARNALNKILVDRTAASQRGDSAEVARLNEEAIALEARLKEMERKHLDKLIEEA